MSETAERNGEAGASFSEDVRKISDYIDRLQNTNAELLSALSGLVAIVDKARLENLMNGVQLGPVSWFVKASERMDYARAVIAKAEVRAAALTGEAQS